MVGHLEEQITIMPPIATATEVKKDSCIFVPGLVNYCSLLVDAKMFLSTTSDKQW